MPAGLHNGSARSSELQAASIEMHKLGNSQWWITALVPRPARCKARHEELGCARRFRFAAGQGWQLLIDFFASACNRLTDWYILWSNDPACELVDAFAARSWNSSQYPHCEWCHRGVGFFLPPNGLQDRVVRRAKSDGACGVFLVPCNPKHLFMWRFGNMQWPR